MKQDRPCSKEFHSLPANGQDWLSKLKGGYLYKGGGSRQTLTYCGLHMVLGEQFKTKNNAMWDHHIRNTSLGGTRCWHSRVGEKGLEE